MKRDNFPVTQEAVRPVGEPDKCYLCGVPLEEQHKQGCVFRERTVIIELKCNLLVSVPEDWDAQMVEFHFNESSYCTSNLIGELQLLDKRTGCICPFSEVSFISEASREDEINYNYPTAETNSPKAEGKPEIEAIK